MKKFYETKADADKAFAKYPTKVREAVDFYYSPRMCASGFYSLRKPNCSCQCDACMEKAEKTRSMRTEKKWIKLAAGQFSVAQGFLEAEENQLRRRTARENGETYYHTVTTCRHGSTLKTVEKNLRCCKHCAAETRKRKNETANMRKQGNLSLASQIIAELRRLDEEYIDTYNYAHLLKEEERRIKKAKELAKKLVPPPKNVKEKRSRQMSMSAGYEDEIKWVAKSLPPQPTMMDARLNAVWR